MTEQEVLTKLHKGNLEMFHSFDSICKKYNIQYFAAYGTLLGAIRHKGFIPWDDDVDVWMTRDEYKKLCEHKDEFGANYEFVMPEDFGDNKYFEQLPRLYCKSMYVKMDEDLCQYYDNKINRIPLDIFLIDKTRKGILGAVQRLELKLLLGLMRAYGHPGKSKLNFPGYKLAEFVLTTIGRFIPLCKLRECYEKVALRFQDSSKAKYFFCSVIFDMRALYPLRALEEALWADFEDMKVPIPADADELLRIYYGDYMKLPPVEERVPHFRAYDNFISTDDITFTSTAEDI